MRGCVCAREKWKKFPFSRSSIVSSLLLSPLFLRRTPYMAFPLILALQGPARDERDICDAHGSALKAKRTFPSCVNHQRGLLLACLPGLSSRITRGYDLGTPGLKNHLWLHQEDLFHPEDHRRAKDLDKKGGSALWSVIYMTYREGPLGFECQNPSGNCHSINIVFLVLGCPRSSLRFFCNSLLKNTNGLFWPTQWIIKKAECWRIVVLEKTLESPLGSKEIQPVHLNGNQFWIFIGRTDAEAKTPILWSPDMKNWRIGKDSDAGKDWRREEKGITEDERVGWHHWLNGHEFE